MYGACGCFAYAAWIRLYVSVGLWGVAGCGFALVFAPVVACTAQGFMLGKQPCGPRLTLFFFSVTDPTFIDIYKVSQAAGCFPHLITHVYVYR